MLVALIVIGSLAAVMIAYYGPRYYHWEKHPWPPIEGIGWPYAVDREPRGCLWVPVAVLVVDIVAIAYVLASR